MRISVCSIINLFHYSSFSYSIYAIVRVAGVNDNAAGVAAMLEMSKQVIMADSPRENTLIFVAFDLEEYVSTNANMAIFVRYFPPM